MCATTNIVTILLVYCSWGLPTDNGLEFNSGLKLKSKFGSACIKFVIKTWIKPCNFIWWYLQIWHKQFLSLMLWSNILDHGNSAFLWRTFFLIVFFWVTEKKDFWHLFTMPVPQLLLNYFYNLRMLLAFTLPVLTSVSVFTVTKDSMEETYF